MSVVVTGYGLCTPALPPLLELIDGEASAYGDAPSETGLPVRKLDEAAFTSWVPKRYLRKMDRLSRITTAAVGQALQSAGLTEPELINQSGLVLTTAFGSAGVVSRVLDDVLSDDPVISPLIFPNVVANAAAGHASISFGLRGPNSVLGGVGGLMYAYDLLVTGRADRLLVGGFDEVTAVYEQALIAASFTQAVTALGEGAAVIVLETDASARSRGAKPLAELAAVSVASDLDFSLDGVKAYAGDGMERALDRVMRDAPAPDLLIGSGWPGTGLHEIESRRARETGAGSVSWPKQHTGEMFACSAALNAVLAVAALSGGADAGRAEAGGAPQTVLVTGHDSSRGQSEAAYFCTPGGPATESSRRIA